MFSNQYRQFGDVAVQFFYDDEYEYVSVEFGQWTIVPLGSQVCRQQGETRIQSSQTQYPFKPEEEQQQEDHRTSKSLNGGRWGVGVSYSRTRDMCDQEESQPADASFQQKSSDFKPPKKFVWWQSSSDDEDEDVDDEGQQGDNQNILEQKLNNQQLPNYQLPSADFFGGDVDEDAGSRKSRFSCSWRSSSDDDADKNVQGHSLYNDFCKLQYDDVKGFKQKDTRLEASPKKLQEPSSQFWDRIFEQYPFQRLDSGKHQPQPQPQPHPQQQPNRWNSSPEKQKGVKFQLLEHPCLEKGSLVKILPYKRIGNQQVFFKGRVKRVEKVFHGPKPRFLVKLQEGRQHIGFVVEYFDETLQNWQIIADLGNNQSCDGKNIGVDQNNGIKNQDIYQLQFPCSSSTYAENIGQLNCSQSNANINNFNNFISTENDCNINQFEEEDEESKMLELNDFFQQLKKEYQNKNVGKNSEYNVGAQNYNQFQTRGYNQNSKQIQQSRQVNFKSLNMNKNNNNNSCNIDKFEDEKNNNNNNNNTNTGLGEQNVTPNFYEFFQQLKNGNQNSNGDNSTGSTDWGSAESLNFDQRSQNSSLQKQYENHPKPPRKFQLRK